MYIGNQPLTKATLDRRTYTGVATDTFNFAYNRNFLEVYVNGKLLPKSDYTAQNGTSVVLPAPVDVSDVVEFVLYNTFNPADTYTQSEIQNLDAENVKLNGNQTINDVKEFTSSPIVPAGSGAGEVANVDQVIGVNQTWQDVTASRSAGVTYTNTTGKPIEVSIYASSDNSINISLQVDDAIAFKSINGFIGNVRAIIPNGSTYALINGTGNLFNWNELR
jgi:hypothetical protein